MRDTTTASTTHTPRRYVGPDAWEIAQLLPQRVRFERGWFHTEAICHDSQDDSLSFRQRPDGGAIDVRCHAEVRCSGQRVIKRLEELTGRSIWAAYEPISPANKVASQPAATNSQRRWADLRLIIIGAVIAMLVAPLAFGYGLEVAALNGFGLGWFGLTVWRVQRARPQRLAAGQRARNEARR